MSALHIVLTGLASVLVFAFAAAILLIRGSTPDEDLAAMDRIDRERRNPK